MDKKQFKELTKKLDMLIAIELAKAGLSRAEVAEALDTSEKSIERMFPFNKIKKSTK